MYRRLEAWFDRWLKQDGETGFANADERLLAEDTGGTEEASWRQRLSFYFRSSRDFPTRAGIDQVCEDIRIGCEVAAPAPEAPSTAPAAPAPDPVSTPDTAAPAAAPATPTPSLPATGGGLTVLVFGIAAAATRRRR